MTVYFLFTVLDQMWRLFALYLTHTCIHDSGSTGIIKGTISRFSAIVSE